ncbi:acetoin utilization protein AcuC [Georgenia wangjunii]|uniref:acetoin utilization protein AcuC n=1 Tax=Georgenia wangjunii TaxID=3117730 RepID=UPI002F2616FC
MPSPALLMWSEDLLDYDFGAGHPMTPLRLRLTLDLLGDLDLLRHVDVRAVETATDAELALAHEPAYIEAVKAAGAGTPCPERGLGLEDNPVFAQVHAAGARIAGSTLGAVRAVWQGSHDRAVSLAGGMHHAMAGRASGFCVYNDVAVSIAWLLANGAERVAYVDVDAHHGDGVERTFWDDERVLTISVHQHPGSLFPGTGYPQDVGPAAARGMAVNLALPAGTDGGPWLRGLEAVAAPLVAEFAPQVLVSQHGCDAHARDPLAGLDVSVDAQREAALLIAGLADAHAEGRWVATGGGGYDVAGVVPRVWAHLVAVAAGRPVGATTPLPQAWLERTRELADVDVPLTMGDGHPVTLKPWNEGFNPDDAVDRAIMATRNAVFPWHGLDPLTA